MGISLHAFFEGGTAKQSLPESSVREADRSSRTSFPLQPAVDWVSYGKLSRRRVSAVIKHWTLVYT